MFLRMRISCVLGEFCLCISVQCVLMSFAPHPAIFMLFPFLCASMHMFNALDALLQVHKVSSAYLSHFNEFFTLSAGIVAFFMLCTSMHNVCLSCSAFHNHLTCMGTALWFQKVSLAVLISFGAFWWFSIHLKSYLHPFQHFGHLCTHLSCLQGFQSHPPHICCVLCQLPCMLCPHHHGSFHPLHSTRSVHLLTITECRHRTCYGPVRINGKCYH